MKFLGASLIFLIFISCRKSGSSPLPPAGNPPVTLVSLHDAAVSLGHPFTGDLDADGIPDIKFSVLAVGDPIYRTDKFQYRVQSAGSARLLLHTNETSPLLANGDFIKVQLTYPFAWQIGMTSLLLQKKVPLNGPIVWEGDWLQARHHFLGLQVWRNNRYHQAWIEISFHPESESLLLHRAGICQLPEVNIRAGR